VLVGDCRVFSWSIDVAIVRVAETFGIDLGRIVFMSDCIHRVVQTLLLRLPFSSLENTSDWAVHSQ